MGLLKDKTAIITGGSNGIGKSTVRRFCEEGARVIIWDLAVSAGRQTIKELQADDFQVSFLRADVSDIDEVQQATEETLSQYGRIDILMNNAGITRDATLSKMNSEQWQQVIDVNLTGVYNCVKAVSSSMIHQGSGVILNASSIVGIYGNFGQINYSAAKGGLIAMTKTMSKELGRKGIRVNAVAPGFVLTDMVRAMPEHILNGISEKIPLKRLGRPEEIANVYVFLASDLSGYITGAVLGADGGLIL